MRVMRWEVEVCRRRVSQYGHRKLTLPHNYVNARPRCHGSMEPSIASDFYHCQFIVHHIILVSIAAGTSQDTAIGRGPVRPIRSWLIDIRIGMFKRRLVTYNIDTFIERSLGLYMLMKV